MSSASRRTTGEFDAEGVGIPRSAQEVEHGADACFGNRSIEGNGLNDVERVNDAVRQCGLCATAGRPPRVEDGTAQVVEQPVDGERPVAGRHDVGQAREVAAGGL